MYLPIDKRGTIFIGRMDTQTLFLIFIFILFLVRWIRSSLKSFVRFRSDSDPVYQNQNVDRETW